MIILQLKSTLSTGFGEKKADYGASIDSLSTLGFGEIAVSYLDFGKIIMYGIDPTCNVNMQPYGKSSAQ